MKTIIKDSNSSKMTSAQLDDISNAISSLESTMCSAAEVFKSICYSEMPESMVTATAHMASCALEAKSSEITGELRSIIGDLRKQN
jgi:archaellum biogenesis ATPase FlaH